MIINYYEAYGMDRIDGAKDRRCVVAYVDGDREKFIISSGMKEVRRYDWDRKQYVVTGEKPEYSVYHVTCPAYQRDRCWSRKHVKSVSSMLEAKKCILEWLKEHSEEERPEERKQRVKAAYLPGGENKDFYPTPERLAGKILRYVDWKNVREILEPSAGKGDLIDAAMKCIAGKECFVGYDLSREPKKHIDVIELDYNLRMILRGREFRLVGDDFLNYRSNKRYDLILMNPPFSDGAAHLLHAIHLQKNGGQIVCLLNAETIRNPYTTERMTLNRWLAKYEAKIEFVKDAFRDAERRTSVEVAIVYLNIPKVRMESEILKGAKKAVEQDFSSRKPNQEQIVIADEILGLIEYFNLEARAGVDFLMAYDALTPYIRSTDKENSEPLIKVKVDADYSTGSNVAINGYLKALRYKYWRILLDRPKVREKLTSQMQSDYYDKVAEMAEYDFDRHNVMQVLYDIQMQLQQGVEDSIMALFSKLSDEHSWSREVDNGNIHYYNGWATNKAWKVGMKVILPINGFSSYSWQEDELRSYDITKIISDMERAMSYLDKGEIKWQIDPGSVIDVANKTHRSRKELDFTYFTAKFYKKGTCHIKFKPEAAPIVDRLNIFAARKRNWLPPSYGREKYADMDEAERTVIDEFQGAEEYAKVMENPSHYVIETAQLQPMLTQGA